MGNCSPFSAVDYGDFSSRIHEQASSERVPITGTLTLTHRCNLKCRHCYCVVDKHARELSTNEIFSLLDQIADAGCLWLLLTGGEPLLRQDFREIYLYAKRKGFIVTLFTNGTLLDSGIIDLLAAYPPFVVEITLYGMSEEIYACVTGVSGALRHCLEGISMLRERGIPLKIKTTLTQDNVAELQAVKSYAENILRSDFRFDVLLWPKIDGTGDHLSLRIPEERVVGLEEADTRRKDAWRQFIRQFPRQPVTDQVFTCSAGRVSFDIDPYGRLRLCDMVRNFSYDLLKGSFAQGWDEFIPRILETKEKSPDIPCRDCADISFCDICPAWSILETGQVSAFVDYLCRIAHARAQVFL